MLDFLLHATEHHPNSYTYRGRKKNFTYEGQIYMVTTMAPDFSIATLETRR